jgi:UDP-N-acetylglucosamine diphosphorylase / glucose-1-phosphate thymidylyltransferase / UDP-N-acetylgalactosamine diphosphorylase / glucosamine-1-phosphate N-acetyltransferase / galactosamine-1-phosphate N-acetyltransferase
MLTTQSFFDLSDFPDRQLFNPEDHVWQPLNDLKDYMDAYRYPKYDNVYIRNGVPLTEHVIIHQGQTLCFNDLEVIFGDTTKGELQVKRAGMLLEGASVIMAGAVLLGKKIALGKGVLVETGAMIKSPAIIGDMSEVRQGAYLRGYCLTGKRCVLGHTTEIKHCILLNDAKAGHFAYLGDSILGNDVNLGAGTKLANLKFLPGNVNVVYQGEVINTSRRKLGAILGDTCLTGCNSVTSPGTLMAKNAILMPNATAKGGYHPEKAIIR